MHRDESAIDRNARLVVKMLMDATGTTKEDLGRWIGRKRSTVDAKLAGSVRFTLGELDELARRFNVDPGKFFRSPRELLGAGPPSEGKGALLESAGQARLFSMAA